MNNDESQEKAIAITSNENSLLGLALTEVLGIVGAAVKKTMAHDAASSEAYTAELRGRITKLDEEMIAEGITGEETEKKRSEQTGYLRDLKDEATAVRASGFKTMVCISAFGVIAVYALLSESRASSLLVQCAKGLAPKAKPAIGFR